MYCVCRSTARRLPAQTWQVAVASNAAGKFRCLVTARTGSPLGFDPRCLEPARFPQEPINISIPYVQSEPRAARPFDMGMTFGLEAINHSGIVKESHLGRFYQKHLPESLVPFTSKRGRQLFRESLESGFAENFFFLSEQFRTQDEPTYCGLSTLAMVLNSLHIDPMRTWKGVWRWFNEQNLGCCTGTSRVLEEGLTFDMFKRMASCNGAIAIAHRAPLNNDGEGGKEQAEFVDLFRSSVRGTCRSLERDFIVISYSREALGQSGAGHFSPIGGYHEESDSVLVMDVASFKYPMHWVPIEDLVQAMSCIDPVVGLPRGFLQLRSRPPAVEPRHSMKPLHVPQIPRAAGRKLYAALVKALAASHATSALEKVGRRETCSSRAMCRWLQAASSAEPQVLRRLVQVGDVMAFKEMVGCLHESPLYAELQSAYAALMELGLAEDFPPLRFSDPAAAALELEEDKISLDTCGELWVLLLLLMPQHIRAAVAEELSEPLLSRNPAKKTLRGPWALPLEALREVLADILQPPQSQQCSQY